MVFTVEQRKRTTNGPQKLLVRLIMNAIRMLPAKDRSVASAPYEGIGPATEYRIAGNPGLILVVAKPNRSGAFRRTWRCYYSATQNGKRHRRKIRLGLYPATTLADARASAARLMSEVDHGRDPFAEARKRIDFAERPRLTFADLVEDYLKEWTGLVTSDAHRSMVRDQGVGPSPGQDQRHEESQDRCGAETGRDHASHVAFRRKIPLCHTGRSRLWSMTVN